MSEHLTTQDSVDPAEQSSLVYQAENDAQQQVNAAGTMVEIADERFGNGSGEEGGEESFEAEDAADFLEAANKTLDVAKTQSNDFAAQNMDTLHESALKEAAARVTDVYKDSEEHDA